ncbi:non-ribosomal peptide synthetase [Paenibacillus sp. 481]|uniref:non-ribosomal peptide synthetase n=1 Tax=Paenibacillus sp. 481 TaxID=2835869 RepID=UPI001E3D7235|nr:non-ribosomal peptide synthetase [Paenibacillus sp. 481]UHA73334.1 amino acid adenylation domain-containing protein [Paenibacillus sp. 481]
MMPEVERRRLLHEFNDTEASFPREATLQQLFEQQADVFPNRVALSCLNKTLTYRELNERANMLAKVLREKGVMPNQIIGVLCSRSAEMVISILAVLKAGGAYMPIDPEYPVDRIGYMLEDSGTVLCIVEETSLIPQHTTVQVLSLDMIEMHASSDAEHVNSTMPNATCIHNLDPVNKPEDLAYVIYTSGSTGKPKGVMIEHRNVVRLLFNDRNLFDFNENDVWTLFHSFCFDFSVWEMYGALLYGGKLVIVPQSIAREPERFLALLREEQVTVLNQTPTAFYQLAKLEEQLDMPVDLQVRNVIFGGEALLPIQLLSWKKKYPNTKLINMYGITETTVHVTYKEIGFEEIQLRTSNIGKPIPTLQIYILDEQRELNPIGVEGEIYVGGEGVARGYVNRPELTSERFIPHPFEPGKRLYRTGDLARWLSNGELEYLGRMDHQVKIRGYRIELGEIEFRLLGCEGIHEAVAVVKKDAADEDTLCAYYVSDRPYQTAELRTQLLQHLPQYMLPAHFIPLQSIPTTRNNKVDVTALPSPVQYAIPAEGVKLVAPETELQWQMLNIWKESLHNPNIGVTSNYFDYGGDSIRVIELISRMNKELAMNIQIVDLYKHPTIKGLIEQSVTYDSIDNTREEVEAELQQMQLEWLSNPAYRSFLPAAVEDLFPMSDIQQGMVFHYMKHEGAGVYHDQFVYRINDNRMNVTSLQVVMTELVKKHPMLRTGFNIGDFPIPVQYVCKQINIPIVEVELRSGTPEQIKNEITAYMEQDRAHPFPIHEAPLWRMVLFTSANEKYVCWIFHHAILDGWSVAVFMSELLNLYGALRGGEISA